MSTTRARGDGKKLAILKGDKRKNISREREGKIAWVRRGRTELDKVRTKEQGRGDKRSIDWAEGENDDDPKTEE